MCYGIYVHFNYPELFESQFLEYFGQDCASQFVKHVEQLQEIFYTLLQTNKEIIMTEESQICILWSKKCIGECDGFERVESTTNYILVHFKNILSMKLSIENESI